MYSSFFGLRENPFNLTPDPKYLYLSAQHREALNHLIYGINERKGFIVVSGGIGTGKTTICRALLASLDSSVDSALIFNSYVTDIELLEAVNQEFGISMEGMERGKKSYIDALNRFLLDNFASGRNAIILIDEAQNLSNEVLEQIRMLSNLETEREKLLQIILVGQPELREKLKSPELRQLNERITVRYDLGHLDGDDVKNYIEHRLEVAGNKGNLRFSDAACRRIYRHSSGNPRRINAVSDRALLIAFTKYTNQAFSIDGEEIKSAISDLEGRGAKKPLPRPGRAWPVILILAAALAATAAAAWTGGWTGGWSGWLENLLGLFGL
jgi:general secretion pathway protein A